MITKNPNDSEGTAMQPNSDPSTGYEADSMRCSTCEQQGLRMQYGSYVCDRCDVAYGYNHIVVWNKGFEAGMRHNALGEKSGATTYNDKIEAFWSIQPSSGKAFL